MRLLILGGTAFLGRHLTEAALACGHELTLFTRGQTNPGLYPEAEHLLGDRELDLSALAGREFDAVIDTCGYLPSAVRASTAALAGRTGLYVFVSTISVYEDAPVLSELTPTWRPNDPESRDVNRNYGGLKTLCEEAVETAIPDSALVIRPGLIVGAYDYTGRFGYWPARVAQGGEVLAPGRPATRVWLIDGRDLAEWTIRLIEGGTTGVFNAAGPAAELTMGELLDECRAVSGSDASFVWVDDRFLVERDVVPYSELPLWVPDGYPEIEISRAIAAGLTFRPIGETIHAVLADGRQDSSPPGVFGWERPPAGLDPERERALLVEWRAG